MYSNSVSYPRADYYLQNNIQQGFNNMNQQSIVQQNILNNNIAVNYQSPAQFYMPQQTAPMGAFAGAYAGPGGAFAGAGAGGGAGAIAGAFAGGNTGAFAGAFAGNSTAPQMQTQYVPIPVPVPVQQPQPQPKPKKKKSNKLLTSLLMMMAFSNLFNRNRATEPTTVETNTTEFLVEGGKPKQTPLVFDVNGDGVKTSDQKTHFDIDGDGKLDNINDVSAGDGTLTLDTDKNGKSGENGKELLGNNTDLNGDGIPDGFGDGFESLKGLAEEAKRQGLINNDDYLDPTELAILDRVYGLKIKLGGLNSEAVSLAKAGINGINLSNGAKNPFRNFDGRGNDTLRQQGASFTRNDGSNGGYEDVLFKA